MREKNILQLFEASVEKYSAKEVFADGDRSISYCELKDRARRIGSCLGNSHLRNAPVAIYLDRSVKSMEALLGVAYSGNFYTMMDIQMPKDRLKVILENLQPFAILTDREHEEAARELLPQGAVIVYETAVEQEVSSWLLKDIRRAMIETDPLYVLYTSGSTGEPKGVVVSHDSVIAYTDWVVETFGISQDTVFGSQTPFYFSMSVLDIFSTIRIGASMQIIPRQLFSFPMQLLEYLRDRKVNTIYWVPSALCLVANWKALDYMELPDLKKVLFAGEVMPMKQLNIWRTHMPDLLYANLYGPTEITDICTYYIVDRDFEDEEVLPIGKACNNCDILILNEDGRKVPYGEEGELCVRGPFLAKGYYRSPEKTNSVFVQNPCNDRYPELIYKTGDIVKYNELGELMYVSRKDFQIKHMGCRIELGEIEAAAGSLENIDNCVCVYDENEKKIILVYKGKNVDQNTVITKIKNKVPSYMYPGLYILTEKMPVNTNGKIDRKWLQRNYKKLGGICNG